MRTSPGTMKHSPPMTAPTARRRRQAQKMASWVEAGPGRRLVAAIPSSNSVAVSHRRSSTHRRRSRAMWAGGPPKPVQPMRAHSRAISASGTTGPGAGAPSGTSAVTGPGPGARAGRWGPAGRSGPRSGRARCEGIPRRRPALRRRPGRRPGDRLGDRPPGRRGATRSTVLAGAWGMPTRDRPTDTRRAGTVRVTCKGESHHADVADRHRDRGGGDGHRCRRARRPRRRGGPSDRGTRGPGPGGGGHMERARNLRHAGHRDRPPGGGQHLGDHRRGQRRERWDGGHRWPSRHRRRGGTGDGHVPPGGQRGTHRGDGLRRRGRQQHDRRWQRGQRWGRVECRRGRRIGRVRRHLRVGRRWGQRRRRRVPRAVLRDHLHPIDPGLRGHRSGTLRGRGGRRRRRGGMSNCSGIAAGTGGNAGTPTGDPGAQGHNGGSGIEPETAPRRRAPAGPAASGTQPPPGATAHTWSATRSAPAAGAAGSGAGQGGRAAPPTATGPAAAAAGRRGSAPPASRLATPNWPAAAPSR